MLKQWLDKLLAIFSKTKLTEEELIAYGRQLEREERKQQEQVVVWTDPTVYRTGAYDAPSPTTDGKMRAEGMRERSLSHQMYPHPGDLSRHVSEVERKKFVTRKLEPTATEILPVMPRPRKLHFQRLYAEPDSTFNAL
jgi:hypothetical protein